MRLPEIIVNYNPYKWSLVMIIRKIFSLLFHPLILAVLFFTLAGSFFIHGESNTAEHRIQRDLERFKRDVASRDDEAASRIAELDRNSQLGIVAGYRTVGVGGQRRAALSEMVSQTREHGAPVRSRIISVALEQNLRGDSLEDYLSAHSVLAEFLEAELGTGHQYAALLEEAQRTPGVWAMVRDDAFALVIWSALRDHELLSFYHRNREWLMEPLAMMDFDELNGNEWSLESALRRLIVVEPVLRDVLEHDRADLGIFGLAVLLTHAELVNSAVQRNRLDPAEVVRIIFMNPNEFDSLAHTTSGVREKANELAQIQSHSPVVWVAAQEFAFTLRLFKDAPDITPNVLRKYGDGDLALLIYQWFEDREEVRQALRAIDAFGDMAIFVFGNFQHENVLMRRLLMDPDVSIALIPFLMKYWEEGFDRIERNKNWVRKYFNPENGSVIDPNWIQYIPFGAPLNVANNWKNGVPSEWSELGWAAYDVGSAALAIATWGASAKATTSAQAGARGKRVLTTAGRMTRAQSGARWSGTIARNSVQGGRLAASGRFFQSAFRSGQLVGTYIWGSVRTVGITISKVIQAIPNNWARLAPTARKVIKATAFAGSLYLRIHYTTIPNMDRITDGLAQLISKATTGIAEATIVTIRKAVENIVREILPEKTNRPILYIIALSLLLFGLKHLYVFGKEIRNRHVKLA